MNPKCTKCGEEIKGTVAVLMPTTDKTETHMCIKCGRKVMDRIKQEGTE